MCKQPILCVLIDGSAYRWLSASKHRKSIKFFTGRRALKENGAFSSRHLVATVKDTVKWFSQKMNSTFVIVITLVSVILAYIINDGSKRRIKELV